MQLLQIEEGWSGEICYTCTKGRQRDYITIKNTVLTHEWIPDVIIIIIII